MSKTIKLSLLTVAFLSSLHAENQYTLDSIDVTASQGTTLNKKDVTDSVTIITKEALQEARITTLDEALSKLGNIPITQNGGPGKSTSLYLRGMDSKRILILIDGVRYNNPTTIGAAAEFSQIMLYNVEQIEIVKGAQSGIWGSDASGGVINIVTSKAKQGLHGVIAAEYGSYDSKKGTLRASYATQTFDILVAGSSYHTDSFSAVEPVKSSPNYGKRYDELGLEKDKYTNDSLDVKLGFNITQNDRIEASVQAINSFVKYDASDYDWMTGISTPRDSDIPNTTLQNRFYNLKFKHSDSINDLVINYNLSTFNRYIDGEQWGGGVAQYNYKGSVNELRLDDKISYMQDSFLRVGASYQKFEQEEITAGTNKSYTAKSLFATNYNKFKLISDLNTIITESIRYDKYNNFDNTTTGKIGLKQFLYKDFYFSANVGTGFNAPTLGQLYGQWGANPNLKPETSQTSDITLGNDILSITGFYNQIDDLIDWVGAGYIQLEGKSKFKGVEITYQDYFFDSLGVNAMYTYLKTQDIDGKALARRPKTQIDANIVYYATQTLDVGLNAQYIGKRYNRADNQGAQTGKYTVANFVTNFKVNDYITVYGKINNITDKYYQTIDGYATPARSLYLGLVAKY